MSRRAIAVLLCWMLSPSSGWTQEGRDETKSQIQIQLSKQAPGTLLELTLTDGSKVIGHLQQVQGETVRIRVGNGKAAVPREIPVDQIRALRRRSHTPVATWIVVGVLAGVAIAIIIGVAKYLHNE